MAYSLIYNMRENVLN